MTAMRTLLASFFMLAVFAANSYAASVTFGDNNRYWGDKAGWTTGQWDADKAYSSWDGNSIDVIGDPNITGGTAVFTSTNRLKSVSFDYYAPFNTWNMLSPGNLFINVLNGNDTTWDYIVNTMGNPKTQATDPTAKSNKYDVYDVSSKSISAQRNPGSDIAADNPNYILSGQDLSGDWAGYIIRDNHPIGISTAGFNGSTNIGLASFSGFPGDTPYGDTPQGLHPKGTATYDFSGLAGGGLDIYGKDIIVAWGTTCANDVIYEHIPIPTPEPSTFLLLGLGLAGFCFAAKKRKV